LATPFDCLIIDEVAQLKEVESVIALQIKGVTHAFLIGDPKQLPATVISKVCLQWLFQKSLLNVTFLQILIKLFIPCNNWFISLQKK